MVTEMVELDKPLAYVLGTQPFHPLPTELLVRPPTLIPRPETEHWVSLLTARLLATSSLTPARSGQPRQSFRILDIGTGTGCIALALTHALSSTGRRMVQTIAVDRAETALQLATENAKRCGLLCPDIEKTGTNSILPPSSTSGVSLHKSDIFSDSFAAEAMHLASPIAVRQPFDLVVSNPPYIPLLEYAQLERSVLEWEDRGALVGEAVSAQARQSGTESLAEDDGLVFYRRIVSLLEGLLRPPDSPNLSALPPSSPGDKRPVVAFEVGKGQARSVERLLLERGFKTEVVNDPWGVERAVFGLK
ncbi:hypothetical protein JCM11641_004897 [Rhodosporidiobolus odoratus]